MRSRTMSFVWLSSAALVATASIAHFVTNNYWHHRLPNQLFKRVKRILAAKGDISGGWIDMTPAAGVVNDAVVASYHGGVTLTTSTGQHEYQFDIAEDGSVLDLSRIN